MLQALFGPRLRSHREQNIQSWHAPQAIGGITSHRSDSYEQRQQQQITLIPVCWSLTTVVAGLLLSSRKIRDFQQAAVLKAIKSKVMVGPGVTLNAQKIQQSQSSELHAWSPKVSCVNRCSSESCPNTMASLHGQDM